MKFFSYLWSGGRGPPGRKPDLYLERPDGLNERICEEDLYRYTKHRWLFNEGSHLSQRYLKFNLQQLIRVAIDSCDGAHYCTRVTKCAEGLYNKAFILEMNNGSEVFAKLPNPNAGPAHFTVASEVATRELLRHVFDVPVPRILSWSCNSANNLVGAEYIIEERAPGVRLGSVWNQWPRDLKLQLITQVVDLENKLTSITFDEHGCIYFKKDLRSLVGKAEDIHSHSVDDDALKDFCIGPLTTNELWNGTRRNMKLDRGPWKHPCEYTRAMGLNEMAWIKSHARPRMNYYRSNQNREPPADGVTLLEKYVDVSPYLIPDPNDKTSASNVLWHPDLHLDNVFVDPNTCQITRVVDWQSACVAPLFYQSTVPRLCRHPRPVREGWAIPERPEDFENLSQDEQKKIDDDLESETIHKYYEAQVYKRAPLHWAVLQQPTIPIIRKPVWLVSGVWENPFSDEEINLHFKEEENIKGVGQMLLLFREQAILPVDGMVEAEDYDVARENCRKFKDIFIGLAKDENEGELFRNLWPYQESGST
ncbi:phosphotransferase enzyme family protein [Penicillium verrucosum]|uniref:phosphotransferase enzyme family protein n=1 Tax=Penicillium verrucosum TaxID=60171 RepID=UPI002544F742|nr:phosphotransferase enzyme family protein [Penicillium verrucosum]KAJ5941369.1 phosphotransferase enzyme family protein [Penicillium verrucosum]